MQEVDPLNEEEWEMLLQAEQDMQKSQKRQAEEENAFFASQPLYDATEIARYRQQYGTRERAWDAEDERAWALLSPEEEVGE